MDDQQSQAQAAQNMLQNNSVLQSVPYAVTASNLANNNFNRSHTVNNNNVSVCAVDSIDNNDLTKMDTVPELTDVNLNDMNNVDRFSASPNLLLNERIGDLCVSSGDSRNIIIDSCDADQFIAPSEQQLLQVIQIKTARITELETLLRGKENEIAELKSHLDKFQSVFPFSRGRKAGVQGAHGQRQRAQGISAEPQSETSVLELLHVTFPKYDKEER